MRTAMYSALEGNGHPLLDLQGQIVPETIALQARYDHVILDAHAILHRPIIATALREANPRIKLYAYVLRGNVWRNPAPAFGLENDLPWALWNIVSNTNGFLYRTSGSYWDQTVNCTNIETMLSIADYLSGSRIDSLFDGLFLDVCCPGALNAAASGIDLDRSGGWRTDAEFSAAWVFGHQAFMERLRTRLGPNFPIMGNCGPGAERHLFNGWMRENFPFQGCREPLDDYGSNWYQNMIMNGFAAPGVLHEAYLSPRLSWIVSDPGVNETSPYSLRRMRFGLGSALLTDHAVFSFGRKEWQPRRFWWYPEYNADLGQPIGPPSKEGELWARRFQNGQVLVNTSTASSISVYGLPLCAPPLKARKRAWNVPASDALILINQG